MRDTREMIKTFTGKNSYGLSAELKALNSTYLAEAGDFAVERIDAGDVDADSILQAVQSLPFLSPKKLVIITNIQSNSAVLDRLEELVERTAGGVEVVIVDPAPDKRKSYFKLLQKLTNVQVFAEKQPQDLVAWAVDTAKEFGSEITPTDANYLIERITANQQLLSSEIEKLSLYSKKIDRKSIDLLTDQSMQSNIFYLLDSAFSGDSAKAVKLYREQRVARIDPHYILAMLVWQLQAIALAVHANPQTESTLTSAGQSPFTAKKSIAIAKRITKQKFKKMVVDLSELDAQIKTNTDPDSALELYLINL
jgi:DNA polymerase-3 subunit delta